MNPNIFSITNDNAERIHTFLAERDLPQETLTKLESDKRIALLCDTLIGQPDETNVNHIQSTPSTLSTNKGLIVIKPEALPFYEQYVSFLEAIDCTAINVGNVIMPTHEQWMQQYGEVVAQYPRAIHSYVTQRALGVRVVQFCYSSEFMQQQTADVSNLFDKTYCGQSTERDTTTLRGAVSNPLLAEHGFGTMEGYAAPFNFTGYFTSGLNEPMRTYNGVHIPGDRHELLKNIETYCGDK